MTLIKKIPTFNRNPFKDHREQIRLWNALDYWSFRIYLVPAGRRSGKSEIPKRYSGKFALEVPERPAQYSHIQLSYIIGIGGPTHKQTKRIWWEDLKSIIPKKFRRKTNESELYIETVLGNQIWVFGLDVPERAEGGFFDLLLIDEFDDTKEGILENNLLPTLSTSGGRIVLFGTPNGFGGRLCEQVLKAKHDVSPFIYHNSKCPDKEFEKRFILDSGPVFHWTSEDILDPIEIERMKTTLDPVAYKQEYGGKFVKTGINAYYNFDERNNVHKSAVYNPDLDLHLSMDFNTAPGVAGLFQETKLWLGSYGIHKIYEHHINNGSNTEIICKALLKLDFFKGHKGRIFAHGDATGGAKKTSSIRGSDWDIVNEIMRIHFGERFIPTSNSSNPPERVRVNSVNSAFSTADGKVHFIINPSCVKTINDYKGVTKLADGSLDKKKDLTLTHHSDSDGYLIHDLRGIISSSGGILDTDF